MPRFGIERMWTSRRKKGTSNKQKIKCYWQELLCRCIHIAQGPNTETLDAIECSDNDSNYIILSVFDCWDMFFSFWNFLVVGFFFYFLWNHETVFIYRVRNDMLPLIWALAGPSWHASDKKRFRSSGWTTSPIYHWCLPSPLFGCCLLLTYTRERSSM